MDDLTKSELCLHLGRICAFSDPQLIELHAKEKVTELFKKINGSAKYLADMLTKENATHQTGRIPLTNLVNA